MKIYLVWEKSDVYSSNDFWIATTDSKQAIDFVNELSKDQTVETYIWVNEHQDGVLEGVKTFYRVHGQLPVEGNKK